MKPEGYPGRPVQDLESHAPSGSHEQLTAGSSSHHAEVNISPFIGRLGASGRGGLSRNAFNEDLLKALPDAAPLMSVSEQFALGPFLTVALWKAALMEGVGSMMLVWVTVYANSSPPTSIRPEAPTPRWGVFDNATFVGPLVGGVLNFFFISLFIFCFGGVTGAHLNPTITIGTFFARLCSLPRAVLYVLFQTGGAAIGGLLARVAHGSRDFKTGGCWILTDAVPVQDAFVIELMTCLILLFFAFGTGLDPRQKEIIGPTLGPFMVGLSLASLSFGTGFVRYGYGGACLNPARCFGSYVGSRFTSFHWIHWVADIAACAIHAFFYHLVPPWKGKL